MLKISHRYRHIYTHDRLDIYALLLEKVSFLECFLWSYIYFIRYCNNPTDITRNHFCEVFLKNHKNLRQMFLKRLRAVTEKTSVLRYDWDVLKTSKICRPFWDVCKRSLRCFSYWRSDWDLSEECYVGWNHFFFFYFIILETKICDFAGFTKFLFRLSKLIFFSN